MFLGRVKLSILRLAIVTFRIAGQLDITAAGTSQRPIPLINFAFSAKGEKRRCTTVEYNIIYFITRDAIFLDFPRSLLRLIIAWQSRSARFILITSAPLFLSPSFRAPCQQLKRLSRGDRGLERADEKDRTRDRAAAVRLGAHPVLRFSPSLAAAPLARSRQCVGKRQCVDHRPALEASRDGTDESESAF